MNWPGSRLRAGMVNLPRLAKSSESVRPCRLMAVVPELYNSIQGSASPEESLSLVFLGQTSLIVMAGNVGKTRLVQFGFPGVAGALLASTSKSVRVTPPCKNVAVKLSPLPLSKYQ